MLFLETHDTFCFNMLECSHEKFLKLLQGFAFFMNTDKFFFDFLIKMAFIILYQTICHILEDIFIFLILYLSFFKFINFSLYTSIIFKFPFVYFLNLFFSFSVDLFFWFFSFLIFPKLIYSVYFFISFSIDPHLIWSFFFLVCLWILK